MFPSLATMETMLISFQCRSLIKSVSQKRRAYWQLKWSTAKKSKQVKLKKRERNWKDEIEILITLWITLYEERPCLLDVSPKDYINRDSKEVVNSQIDLLMSDKYDVSREDYKSKWESVMRNSFVFATMFPRFATGTAKHSVCFPLV